MDVAVSTLLGDTDAALDALNLCEASDHPELVALAHRLEALLRPPPLRRSGGAVPQDLGWELDTSGFGVASLSGPVGEPAATVGGWLDGKLEEFRLALMRCSGH